MSSVSSFVLTLADVATGGVLGRSVMRRANTSLVLKLPSLALTRMSSCCACGAVPEKRLLVLSNVSQAGNALPSAKLAL